MSQEEGKVYCILEGNLILPEGKCYYKYNSGATACTAYLKKGTNPENKRNTKCGHPKRIPLGLKNSIEKTLK